MLSTLCHTSSARTPSTRTSSTPTTQTSSNSYLFTHLQFTMPSAIKQFFQCAARAIQDFVSSILTRAGDDLLRDVLVSLSNRSDRCVIFFPFFSTTDAQPLLVRAHQTLHQLVTQLWVAAEHGDVSNFALVAEQIALLMGEVFILHNLSHLLERAVSNIYFSPL
jgi:hypothetical protein